MQLEAVQLAKQATETLVFFIAACRGPLADVSKFRNLKGPEDT